MSFALDSVGSPTATRTTLLRHPATPASQAAALELAESMLPPIGGIEPSPAPPLARPLALPLMLMLALVAVPTGGDR